eukprot:ANDGO_06011.mRNA.1 Structural maintenance of chromosomes protein 5
METQFAPGAIRKVTFHNFMTYDDASFCPGPRLNLVAAPNGCGKSTIVAAICFVLDGTMSLMNRSDDMKDYVKKGESSAFVEVELHDGPRIRHQISLPKQGASKPDHFFLLNGEKVAQKKIKEVVSSYGIQLSNLTQFLPQERVAEFASLSPREVLDVTQVAVMGDAHAALHANLISKKKETNELEHRLASQSQELEQLLLRLTDAERDRERFLHRQSLLRDCKLIQLRILKLSVLKTTDDLQELRRKRQKLVRDLESCRQTERPFQDRLECVRGFAGTFSTQFSDCEKALEADLVSFRDRQGNLDTKAVDCENAIEAFGTEKAAIRQLSQQITNASQNIVRLETRISQLQRSESVLTMEESTSRLASISQECSSLESQISSIQETVTQNRERMSDRRRRIGIITSRARQVQDTQTRRLNSLFQWKPFLRSVFDMVNDLRNKRLLVGKVFLTPLEIQCLNPLHGVYLSNVLPSSVFGAFVCSVRADKDMIVREALAQHFNCDVYFRELSQEEDAFFASTNRLEAFGRDDEAIFPANYERRPAKISALHPKGVTHWMDQTFSAPPLVKAFLCDDGRLFRIAAGSRDTERFRGDLSFDFLTPTQYVSFRTSIYGSNSVSQSTVNLNSRTIFDPEPAGESPIETAEQEREKATLQQDIQNLEASCHSAEQQIADHRESMRRLQAQRDSIVRETREVSDTQRSISQFRRTKQSAEQRLELSNRRMEDALARIPNAFQIYHSSMSSLSSVVDSATYSLFNWVSSAILRKSATACATQFVKTIESSRDDHRRLEQEVQQVQSEIDEKRREVRRVSEDANKMESELLHESGILHALTPETIQARLDELPSSLPDLETLLSAKESESSIILVHSSVLADYEKLVVRQTELQASVESFKTQVARKLTEVAELCRRWSVPLRRAVERVDVSFRNLAKGMGFAGEVALVEHADYDQWRVEVRVGFRKMDELHVLSAFEQSGGEKSVSTMLYLLSLQNLSLSPIRVVDEINQGMDPNNERNVFVQILLSCRSDGLNPQYFIFTPKLLDSLIPDDFELIQDMTVIGILNGPSNISDDRFKI